MTNDEQVATNYTHRGQVQVVRIAVGAVCLVTLTLLVAIVYRALRGPLKPHRGYDGHDAAVYSLDYDPSRRWVVSGGDDGLRVWRLDNLQTVYRRPGRVDAVAFVGDQHVMCADANEGILLINTTTWTSETVHPLVAPVYRIVAGASKDRKWLAASFSDLPTDENERPTSYDIHVWKLDWKPLAETVLEGHEGPVFALVLHPSLPQLVSWGEDGTLRAWDLASGKQFAQRGEVISRPWRELAEARNVCVFDPSGTTLWTGNRFSGFPEFDGTEVLGGEAAREDPWVWGTHSVAISPNGRWIATGHANGMVRLWDARSHRQVEEFPASLNNTALYSLEFVGDDTLITGGKGTLGGFDALARNLNPDDTVVRIWRLDLP